MRRSAAVAVAVVSLTAARLEAQAPAAAPAAAGKRVRIHVDGAMGLGRSQYAQRSTFQEFHEEGTFAAQHNLRSGPGFELGLTVRFGSWLGVAAALSTVERNVDSTFQVALPHPLFFGQPRRMEGAVAEYAHKETLVHLDLVATRRLGRLDVAVFAGPTLVNVTPALLARPTYAHDYPYDAGDVTLSRLLRRDGDGSGFGFNAGGALDVRLGSSLALGAALRYVGANVDVGGEEAVRVKAGGLRATGGLRLFL